MTATDDLYRNLQKYLDEKTLGFPATPSGSDIRLLRVLFSPEQAKATMCLTHKFEPIDQIHERANQDDMSRPELESALYEAARRGLIFHQEKDGRHYYSNRPYVVGFYEGQVDNLTPEFRAAHQAYMNDGTFGAAFLGAKLPQMRTIPVQKSITPENVVSTYDEIKKFVESSPGPIAILECICRKQAEIEGNPCQKTSRKETCMAFDVWAENELEFGRGRQINTEEALDILRQNEEDGLVFQPNNAQEPSFICSCCGCCCGMLTLHKLLPRPLDFWTSNYQAQVDPDVCSGCQTCIEVCQVAAMKFDEDQGVSYVDVDRCIGCGNCIDACPEEAIRLNKKEAAVVPPRTVDDLYDAIMANKR